MFYRQLLLVLLWRTVMVYTTNLDLQVLAHFKERNELIDKSKSEAIGANLHLTKEEEEVNHILMAWKNQEFADGLADPRTFLAAQHFFKAKSGIEKSKVFAIIKKLPKGASLHSHDLALTSSDYVLNNITFRENLYGKEDENHTIILKFFKNDPGSLWYPISELRQHDKDFDRRLREQITLIRDNPEVAYADVYSIWPIFHNLFPIVEPLLTFRPVFIDHFYQALKELYEDNVKYLEFRGTLPQLYDFDERIYGPEEVLQVYYETSQKFMKDYPDFWGVKFIFAPVRATTTNTLVEYMDFIARMNKKFPNFLAGFDLVDHEDTGPPLKEFIPNLLKLKNITNFFFHAGETLWNGVHVDENLYDAVLLNTTRIGHAYALFKHPKLLEMVKERKIALEICPISNQVLGLVRDLRNHPANYLIANDFPVVIAPDDPGIWGSKALSYDWYLAFMAMASRRADLRLLKQLALNSIIYSSMEGQLKEITLKKWEKDWEKFIKDIIVSYQL